MPEQMIGIVAEFDPFHRGHEYLIRRAREHYPRAPVAVAMSGYFTQRGGAAVLSPHARAEMALSCGADLVVELPLTWAVCSAEGFARGGVAALSHVGANVLAFGSECGQCARLERAAQGLTRPEYPVRLRKTLSTGISFAAARRQALSKVAGEEAAAVLDQPNDLLGVSYLAAIRDSGSTMAALAVPRVGPGHNEEKAEAGFASASAIRQLVRNGDRPGALALLPQAARPVMERELDAGRAPADLNRCERAILYRLRGMSEADFAALPDCSEGLEHRLVRAARQAASLGQFYELAKTRRYAYARLRRMVLWAWLGITADDRPDELPYLRVLGMNRAGQAVLHRQKVARHVPVITKPAAAKALTGEAGRLLALEERAADLWQLCLSTPGPCGGLWTAGPVVLRD